jgi:hypothetical protein
MRNPGGATNKLKNHRFETRRLGKYINLGVLRSWQLLGFLTKITGLYGWRKALCVYFDMSIRNKPSVIRVEAQSKRMGTTDNSGVFNRSDRSLRATDMRRFLTLKLSQVVSNSQSPMLRNVAFG